jgi:Spy/CpxP family protein refolding chaperone
MRKLSRVLVSAGAAFALCLGVGNLLAQNGPPPGGGGPGGGGPGGGGGGRNFDPAQMQQRMMDRVKEQLEVTDDTEWQAMQPLVQKVMEARRDAMGGMMGGRGMFGRGGRQGQAGDNAAPAGGARRGGMFGTPSPEAEALQKAIDAKAGKAELKAALDKYVASRKVKQAALETAQDDLRKVLTPRQEAIATVNGYL